ncbi:MAG: penicillin-binding protein activator LpoB [Victivallaceae bacterium]|nr:penicillin-binding protein activator LpoB [Victivallaceae bacterium]
MKYLGILSALCVMLAGGCGTAAHNIDPSGPEALVTVSSVDPAEWSMVASEAMKSLVESGALKREDGRKSIVMISRVRNYTLLHLDMAILTGKLRQGIQMSGQATVTSAIGYGANLDESIRAVRDLENDDLFNQATVQKRGTVIAPDLSLAGMVLQQQSVSGRKEESYYMFHLTLTDLATGIAIWEKNVDFAKQAERPIL